MSAGTSRLLAGPNEAGPLPPRLLGRGKPLQTDAGDNTVSTDRLLAIYDLISRAEHEGIPHGMLCSVATDITQLDGAAVTLASPGQPLTAFCTSGPTSVALIDFEAIAGEGPCTSANSSDVAVEGSDLALENLLWEAFSPMATSIGVRAVFGFPIRIGMVHLGALGLYRESAGQLTEDQYADGYLMASVIGRSVLAMQSGANVAELSEELQRGAMFDFAVHQAAGMVSVQASISVKDALVVLQSRAFSKGIGIADVAVQIISRQSAYGSDGFGWSAGNG